MKTRTIILILALAAMAAGSAFATTPCPPSTPWPAAVGPMVKAVPWVVPVAPLCSITPHDVISGQSTIVKATVDAASVYYWDFGDGSPAMSWTAVSNPYDLGAAHTYTGSVGQSFTATVYVRDIALNVNSAKYYVTIRDGSTLAVQVNVAIDRGLWFLHRAQIWKSGSGSAIVGNWNGGGNYGYVYAYWVGVSAANTTAFLVNGHAPDADPNNPDPYGETAIRGLNQTLNGLAVQAIPSSETNSHGTFNPDVNGNGSGTYVNDTYPPYQGGMVMDMLVASGMPAYAAPVGATGVVGQTLATITQDMMDWYSYCQQINAGSENGGWRYYCQYGTSDNSVCQWAAIGMIAAIDKFGLSLPAFIGSPPPPGSPVILANLDWVAYDQSPAGFWGYDGPGYIAWSKGAVTPSGMVQLVMDGVTRGAPGGPMNMWDKGENWLRANMQGGGANGWDNPLNYWYGMFSFTKAMLQYPGGALTQLCGRDGSNNLVNCVDWYSDPSVGVATTIVPAQNADGFWWGHEYSSEQGYFETAWATIMLNRTVFQSGLPVAVIDASPSTVINNGSVTTLTGKNSFHQDATKQIVKWEWDVSGTGSGAFVQVSPGPNYPTPLVIHTSSLTFPVNFPIRLRVTDNTAPTPLTAIATLNIVITNPPFPPTANAGGPYNICPQPAYLPFYLNGSGSKAAPGHLGSNPDNYLTNYQWDLLGNGTYPLSGATLIQPQVDAYYASQGLLGSGQTMFVNLRVTDNSAISFGGPNLQGIASTQVKLLLAADQLCSKCVGNGTAVPHGAVPSHAAYIALVWIETGSDHYNIYRGTVNGGPYTKIGTVANTVKGTGGTLGYQDNGPLTLGVPYYYRIAPATLADIETCQSNQANASGTIPRVR